MRRVSTFLLIALSIALPRWAHGQANDRGRGNVPDGASVFTHPRCVNTWRNGALIGNEPPAMGY
jgi:hypothetical protein